VLIYEDDDHDGGDNIVNMINLGKCVAAAASGVDEEGSGNGGGAAADGDFECGGSAAFCDGGDFECGGSASFCDDEGKGGVVADM